MVLNPLRYRGLLQQELGVPLRPPLVQSMERDLGDRSSIRGNRHLERLWRVALYWTAFITPHR